MLADDLGWNDVSYHGGVIQTPHIDSLADRGVQLDQFYAQPVCSPTRAALMTGRYPMRLGMQCGVVKPWAQHGLPLEEQTLADRLSQSGYTTAIVGKWHLGHFEPEYLPLQRGFQKQYGHYNGALDYFTHDREGGHDWHKNDQPLYTEGYTTDLIGQEAVRIIEEHDKDSPLFLYVPFNAPHTPLQAPEEHLERNSHISDKRRRTFAAMVTSMDDAIGQIVNAANANLPRENTLLFFSSDNGGIPALGSNGEFREGKQKLYEGGVRVPTVAVWDGTIKDGSIVSEPLHIVDLYPTLLNLAESEQTQVLPLDGRDAWPTITQDHPTPHEYILHNITPFHGAIRMGDWKLVHNGHVNASAQAKEGPDTWELFNIRKDPSEKNDLSQSHPEKLAQLKEKLMELSLEAATPHTPPLKLPRDFEVPEIWGHIN